MKYSVDRIENNIIVLENLDTKEIKEINKSKLSFKVKEGDILVFKDNVFIKDDKAKEDRLKMMQEKFNKLKKTN